MSRKVHEIEIDFDGDVRKIHYRKPSGDFMFQMADVTQGGKAVSRTTARETFKKCLCHENGESYAKEQIDEFMDLDWDGVKATLDAILPTKASAEKNV